MINAALANPVFALKRQIASTIRNASVGESDFVLASYPKSGNTWLKNLLAIAILGRDVSLDDVETLIPYVGSSKISQSLKNPAGGHLLKTHELPSRKYRYGVLLIRDVREVFLSYYRSLLRSGNPPTSNDRLVRNFLTCGVRPYNTWFSHTRLWLPIAQSDSNWIILNYGDLKARPDLAVIDVLGALGMKDRQANVDLAMSCTTIAALRQKESASRRMRSIRDKSGVSFFGSRDGRELDILEIFDYLLAGEFQFIRALNESIKNIGFSGEPK